MQWGDAQNIKRTSVTLRPLLQGGAPPYLNMPAERVRLNRVTRSNRTAGEFGGACACPDGAMYLVGDNHDDCASLACEGGVAGPCTREKRSAWASRRVACHPLERGLRAVQARLKRQGAHGAPRRAWGPTTGSAW